LGSWEKVLGNLQRTKAHILVYKQSKELELRRYTDSGLAGKYPESTKSISGYVFLLVGGAVAWKTVKQTLTATSTLQAEFIATYEGKRPGLWLKNSLMQTQVLDGIVSRPLKIFCDN
jgi:hypothetical protein